jgi:hypothetical protein
VILNVQSSVFLKNALKNASSKAKQFFKITHVERVILFDTRVELVIIEIIAKI